MGLVMGASVMPDDSRQHTYQSSGDSSPEGNQLNTTNLAQKDLWRCELLTAEAEVFIMG